MTGAITAMGAYDKASANEDDKSCHPLPSEQTIIRHNDMSDKDNILDKLLKKEDVRNTVVKVGVNLLLKQYGKDSWSGVAGTAIDVGFQLAPKVLDYIRSKRCYTLAENAQVIDYLLRDKWPEVCGRVTTNRINEDSSGCTLGRNLEGCNFKFHLGNVRFKVYYCKFERELRVELYGKEQEVLIAAQELIDLSRKVSEKSHYGYCILTVCFEGRCHEILMCGQNTGESGSIKGILPESVESLLRKDIGWFKCAHKWYQEKQIAHRRGYLFSGPPGSGKSTAAMDMTSLFGANELLVINLGSKDVNDDSLIKILSTSKYRAFLLEDVDCVLSGRSGSKISFSTLLNCLDGPFAPKEGIIMMTTNHPELLDPALLRPGRMDRHIKFGLPDDSQVRRIVERFTGSSDPLLEADYLERKLSMAEIQGELMARNIEEASRMGAV